MGEMRDKIPARGQDVLDRLDRAVKELILISEELQAWHREVARKVGQAEAEITKIQEARKPNDLR